MHSKALIRLAKEIKINFQLILIAIVCTLVAHGILYYWLKPPISLQVPRSELEKLQEQMEGITFADSSAYGVSLLDQMAQVGFQNDDDHQLIVPPQDYGQSKYDYEIKFESQMDNLNAHREQCFERDLEDKTIIAFAVFLLGLCIGRYLFLFVRWVNRTSQLE
jgi:hypothetical protein